MRVLVTGGAGFIGSHLVDRFVALGHDTVALDDLSSGSRANVHAKARLVVADVRGKEAAAAITAFAPEVVVHEAAQMDVRKSVVDPGFDADVNIVGILNVLESARKAGALQHVLFASSGGAMYGEQEQYPAPETHPTRPESPYGLAKAVSEQYLDWYRRTYGIKSTALRYANVYGPRQNPHGEAGVVAIFSTRLLQNTDITINGDGKQTRDYVFVEDVVEANAIAFEKRLDGAYNVGTGVETDVVELAAQLKRLSGSTAAIGHGPAKPGEQKRSVVDPQKLQAAAGWRPRTKLDEGLAKTLAFFASRR
jgi:UDP-glucose 4-epimerase